MSTGLLACDGGGDDDNDDDNDDIGDDNDDSDVLALHASASFRRQSCQKGKFEEDTS